MNREQFLACLWLRWRLSRNQFSRGGTLNAIIAVALMVFLGVAAVGFAVGGALLGFFVLGKAAPLASLGAWDAIIAVFLMIWVSGLLVEIQRSESLDLSKLLHLPVSLRQVFVINYILSHFSPSILLFLPVMLGLSAGLILKSGLVMALLVPLALAFVFMVTAWTYCLRGWLAALMVNKRRRRAVIVWITVGFVLVFQLPNLFLNSPMFRGAARSQSQRVRAKEAMREQILMGHMIIPPGWVGYGAMKLAERNPWPAVGASLAGALIGTLGLLRAYRMTIRFYTGAGGGEQRSVEPAPATHAVPAAGPLLVERRLPWLPDDTAGLALATFRSLIRAPELKMALIMPIVVAAIMLSSHFARAKGTPPEALKVFAGTMAALVSTLACANLMSNTFGLDRNGFRALVLLPLRRDHILFAKNLAFFPFILGVALALLVLAKFFFLTSWTTFLAGLLQVLIVYLLFSLVCNVLSILAPYRLAAGTLQAKKPKAVVFLAIFAGLFLLPVVAIPTGLPALAQLAWSHFELAPWLPVNLIGSFVIVLIAGWLYWLILPAQGRLLQRREQSILKEVTEDVE